MKRKGNYFGPQAGLFTPSVVRSLIEENVSVVNVTAASHSGSIQSVTQSFRYDPPGSPIKSTQQIPLDWSKFENHTFFNSAEAKVNAAFDLIINNYPFDGSREETLEFFDSLTGFDKWVYDKFPKYRGFLHFSGSSAAGAVGTHIQVKDIQGSYSPTLSKNSSGNSVLDQGTKPITFDFHLHIPTGSAQGNQVICQRLSGSTTGITLALQSTTAAEPSGSLIMLVTSGSGASRYYLSASMSLSKGNFQPICATYDTTPGNNKVRLYRNFKLRRSSSISEMGALGYAHSAFFIGSGSNHIHPLGGDNTLSFTETLSGAIDEFRVFHENRSGGTQKKYGKQSVYPSRKLKLYFKFNEPTGSYTSKNLALDSSGNSLHSVISGYKESLRNQRGLDIPLKWELTEENPVLFPSYPDTIDLNIDLLASASDYDTNNPNLITNLIPRHYLLESSVFEGFGQTELANVSDQYGEKENFPGGGKLTSAQIIASFLFVWAKHFDELKIHLDHFGRLLKIDPIEEGTVADTFLPFLADYYGVTMPDMFSNQSLDQFYTRKGHKIDTVLSKNNLQYVQNQIWRRILSDMKEIMRSKGTIHSIKSLMRNMGINPDQNFRFREFGGDRTARLSDKRTPRVRILKSLDFSGSFGPGAVSYDPQGVPNNRPFFKSANLMGPSGTWSTGRPEPGPPYPGSNAAYNRNLLSGSWTYEGLYQMTPHSTLKKFHPVTASLVRFATSGSTTLSQKESTFLNLLAFSGSNENNTTGSLSLIFKDTHSTSTKKLVMPLTGVDIFDGNVWSISFGRIRNDLTASVASSSWFLRAGTQVGGTLTNLYESVKLFDTEPPTGETSQSALTTTVNNVSGTVILIGSQSIPTGSSLHGLSYTHADLGSLERSSFFGGRLLGARFWSKALTFKEAKNHALDPMSLGVENPKVNFNFVENVSGSWEKLRMNVDMDQIITGSSAAGEITLKDMSQNSLHATGTGFEVDKNVIKPVTTTFSSISPFFDQSNAPNRIRVRSFLNNENIKKYGGLKAPLHSIPQNEEPIDDTRFSVEVSAVQALNEDIIKIFASLDSFDNILGSPEMQFSEDYPDLEHLRDVYFNRLTDKVNFKTFFEFFKWFDSTIADLIETMIPRRTKFLGVNFVVEPHMLERPKMVYNTYDMYVGPNDRHGLRGTILLQQLVGEIKRY